MKTASCRLAIAYEKNREKERSSRVLYTLDGPFSVGLALSSGKVSSLEKFELTIPFRFTKLVVLLPHVAGACSACQTLREKHAYSSVT